MSLIASRPLPAVDNPYERRFTTYQMLSVHAWKKAVVYYCYIHFKSPRSIPYTFASFCSPFNEFSRTLAQFVHLDVDGQRGVQALPFGALDKVLLVNQEVLQKNESDGIMIR